MRNVGKAIMDWEMMREGDTRGCDVYIGQWKDGKATGQGQIIRDSCKTSIRGEFVDMIPDGLASVTSEKFRFMGQFVNG